MLGPVAGSGYRRQPSLVRRADGQTIQVTPLLYEVLVQTDGRRGYAEIASAVGERMSRLVTPEDIHYLIDVKLRPLGVLRRTDGTQPTVKKLNPLLGLRLRKVVSNPHVTRRITAPFVGLFRPLVVILFLLAFGLTSSWVLFEKGLASAAHQAFYEPGMLLLVFALTTVSAAFHEIGHAAASRYGGALPGSMGVGLYLVWPAFYTDVTDSYRLGRGGRLRVDLGGLYFNAIFAVATLGLWAATGWDALLLLVPAQLLHMVFQLVPFVRFDGYHILADLTGVPNLFAHIKPTLLHLLPTRWGKREPKVLRPWARAVVTLWVLAVVPILTLAFLVMVEVLPRVAATAWDSLGLRWDLVGEGWTNGAASEVTVALLSMAAVALPVLSMSYLLVRVVRRGWLRVWRATAGHRARRTLAVIAGVTGIALLAWAWWPQGQYRPIQPDESGTLFDSAEPIRYGVVEVPIEMPFLSPVADSLDAPSAVGAPSVRPRLVLLRSPEGVSVTEPGPKRVIMLPRPGQDPETPSEKTWIFPDPPAPPENGDRGWPFPFNPPAPPSDGDNQALAVNTEDGSNVQEFAFAVLWVTDGSVDQINEAWALASCSDCRTTAVAFQSILAVGESNIVIPQNRAVAVNYNCQRCETNAVAVQLVATLSRFPSDEAMNKLALVWDELKELEKKAGDMSLDELRMELARIEGVILGILIEDGVLVLPVGNVPELLDSNTAGPSSDEAAADGSMSDSDAPMTDDTSETTTSEDSATTTDEEPTSDSSEPSPAPSEEPVAEPTEEPDPQPSEEPESEPTEEPAPEPTE
jgi:putative peptide zinc metalloprotease protein